MVVGDAAGLVNNIHFEGTNFAIHSGILAGEVAIEALAKKNYTKKVLSIYEKKFKKSFMYQDLKGMPANWQQVLIYNLNELTPHQKFLKRQEEQYRQRELEKQEKMKNNINLAQMSNETLNLENDSSSLSR